MIAVAKDSRTAFGEKLRRYRDDVGMTQKELADAIGVTAAAIARIEKGDAAPSWDTAVKIAEALDRSLDDFLEKAE